MQLKSSIEKLMRQQNLDNLHCQHALDALLDEQSNPLQIAAFLVLLRAKQETSDELFYLVNALKQRMIAINMEQKTLDIVGTGGDGAHTLNISTASAILAASCGVKIAKHGNRAVSSLAGSADVLEALGIAIDLPAEKISAGIREIGIGFCFAPNFNPALGKLRQLRSQLNLPTTFNILGPLLNPCSPEFMLVGVYKESLLMPMADTLKKMGCTKSMVVCGNGLDEISCIGPTKAIEVRSNSLKKFLINPEEYGLPLCTARDLQGKDAKYNASVLLEIFNGSYDLSLTGIANTLILNAATALYLYGIHTSIAEAIPHAKANLIAGKAFTLLNQWREISHD